MNEYEKEYDKEELNAMFIAACIAGNLDICKCLFEKGANSHKEAIYNAALHGHYNLYTLIIESAKVPYFTGFSHSFGFSTGFFKSGLNGAIENGHSVTIARYLENVGLRFDLLRCLSGKIFSQLCVGLSFTSPSNMINHIRRIKNYLSLYDSLNYEKKQEIKDYLVNCHIFHDHDIISERKLNNMYNIAFKFVCKDLMMFINRFVGVSTQVKTTKEKTRRLI